MKNKELVQQLIELAKAQAASPEAITRARMFVESLDELPTFGKVSYPPNDSVSIDWKNGEYMVSVQFPKEIENGQWVLLVSYLPEKGFVSVNGLEKIFKHLPEFIDMMNGTLGGNND
jgi:hypothetical protein